MKAFKSLDKPNTTLTVIFQNSSLNLILLRSTSIMTKSIVNTLDCKTVFDPCIGWGGRMMAQLVWVMIIAIQTCPFTKTFSGLENMADDLGIRDNVTLTTEVLKL